MLYDVLFAVFLLCIAIQLGYILFLFVKFFLIADTQNASTEVKPVSIIICAKNEAANLTQTLPTILAQRYTNDAGNSLYEVIVVNDASDDDTKQVLAGFEKKHTHLKVIHIDSNEERILPGKKFALAKGVEAAMNDILLLTDADCTPNSEHWLAKMVAPIIEGKEIVLGYGAYYGQSSLLNSFIRWETLHTLIQYSSYAMSGLAYMGVGRNLACSKAVLQKAQQSLLWSKIPSGDDDLLVSLSATKNNIALVLDNSAHTVSSAKSNWADWIKQKQRHLSTGKLYMLLPKFLLGIYALVHTVTWLLFVGFLFTGFWQDALIAMGFRSLLYWALWGVVANRLKEKMPIILLPILDISWMLYNFAFSPYIIWKNKMQWK